MEELKIAVHALVLMIKGLRQKWKQPIAFYFSDGDMTALQIKTILKGIIHVLLDTGFIVIATVCDQYSANTNSIKQLIQETSPIKSESDHVKEFYIKEKPIIAMYDRPHEGFLETYPTFI